MCLSLIQLYQKKKFSIVIWLGYIALNHELKITKSKSKIELCSSQVMKFELRPTLLLRAQTRQYFGKSHTFDIIISGLIIRNIFGSILALTVKPTLNTEKLVELIKTKQKVLAVSLTHLSHCIKLKFVTLLTKLFP